MALSDWLTSITGLRGELKTQRHPLRSRLSNDPYYRLQSLEEVRLAAELGMSIDANQATVDDWLRLPGISIRQARLLAALTQSGVQFHALEELAAALGLPVQRLQPFAPILSFCYYDPESPCTIPTVDPNTAPLEALLRVPAIDLFLARAIVHHRAGGRYQNLADLQARLNLPAVLTAELLHYLRF